MLTAFPKRTGVAIALGVALVLAGTAEPVCSAPNCPTIEFLPVAELAGACWYPAPHTSCSAICSFAGLQYSEATRTFAGSDGTAGNCAAVIAALGGVEPVTVTDSDCVSLGIFSGLGCAALDELPLTVRCFTPPTTADAEVIGAIRACGCQLPAAIPLFSPLSSLLAAALLATAISRSPRRRGLAVR